MSLHNERLVPISHLEADWCEWAAKHFEERNGESESPRDVALVVEALREIARKFDAEEQP